MVLQRTGGVAQQAREVAARPALEERRGPARAPTRVGARRRAVEASSAPRAKTPAGATAPAAKASTTAVSGDLTPPCSWRPARDRAEGRARPRAAVARTDDRPGPGTAPG